MSNVKKLESLTDWRTYELETDLLSEPVIRLRLRRLDALEAGAAFYDMGLNRIRTLIQVALEAVAEWDLTDSGKPLEVNAENKTTYLRPLLAEAVKGEGPTLAHAIAGDAQNKDLFRKN